MRGEQRIGRMISHTLVHLPSFTTAEGGPGQLQDPGNQSGSSSMEEGGTPVVEPSLDTFLSVLTGSTFTCVAANERTKTHNPRFSSFDFVVSSCCFNTERIAMK